MTFWVYNMGLGVPVTDKKLLSQLKPVPLDALTGAQAIKQPDENKALLASANDLRANSQDSNKKQHRKEEQGRAGGK